MVWGICKCPGAFDFCMIWYLVCPRLRITNGGIKKEKKERKKKRKKKHTYRSYMAISIVCSIGFIPRELFVVESKETKIF